MVVEPHRRYISDMPFNDQLEELTENLGDCGLFQWLLTLAVYCSSAVWSWSVVQMSFIGQDVGFWCLSLRVNLSNLPFLNLSSLNVNGLCHVGKYASCSSFAFYNKMNTAVSEWALVCNRKWAVAVITTLQMVGAVVGSFCTGHTADTFGRKPTIVVGLLLCIASNAAGCFVSSWQYYALVRLMIGFGTGITLSVEFSLLIETIPASMRSLIVSVPCESICACVFALACWLFSDWRKVHLLTACYGLPFLFALLFAPESFRWLVTKRKFIEAKKVVSLIAKVNRSGQQDLTRIFEVAEAELDSETKAKVHTLLSIFKSVELRSTSIRLSFLWFCISCCWIGLTLGLKGLSTDIYMSIFLTHAVDLSSAATGLFVDRLGRKWFLKVMFLISALFGCGSGGLQHFNVYGVIPTLIALIGKAACTFAFVGMIIYTSELYPTEIRTIGYGFSTGVGKLGTIVAPIIILLDDYVHGLLCFSSGILMFVSVFVILPLRETRNAVLKDTIAQIEVYES